jgi:DNA-binding transcriptional MerR regulator
MSDSKAETTGRGESEAAGRCESEAAGRETYTTGELARACGVTVRTVQYYDERGLLPPSALTEGGRRVYTDADAERLRRILLLKSLGLKLATIRGVLESDVSAQVLLDILREQDERLRCEVEERRSARAAISAMVRSLEDTGRLPERIDPDMESAMVAEKWYRGELRGTYLAMLGVGVVLDAAEVAAIVWWVTSGDWRPFAVVMPVVVVVTALIVRRYRRRVAYLCPHCHEVFVPETREWLFARHTFTTRRVTCTACGERDWCAEVSSERLGG